MDTADAWPGVAEAKIESRRARPRFGVGSDGAGAGGGVDCASCGPPSAENRSWTDIFLGADGSEAGGTSGAGVDEALGMSFAKSLSSSDPEPFVLVAAGAPFARTSLEADARLAVRRCGFGGGGWPGPYLNSLG